MDLRDLSMLQACVVQRVTSARELVFQLPDAVTASLGAIAAIPVRDEQDRIESCLDALLAQRDISGRPFPPGALGLVLLLNNCTDRTAEVVQKHIRTGTIPSLRSVQETSQGLTPARLCGVRSTGAQWTAFVDDETSRPT